MASDNRGYWSRSLELLTRDEGWHKPLLVLAAARLVPIVGAFGADGYALEWARLTAWGVDSSPKQRGVNVSACIKTGARAFVVALGYLIVFSLIRGALGFLLGGFFGGILSLALSVCMAVLITVAKLRSAIYQTIGAGYQVERIADMVRRDHRGLLNIGGMVALMFLVLGLAASMLLGMVLVANMGGLLFDFIEYERYGYADDWMIISSVLNAFAKAIPALCVTSYVIGIGSSFAQLMVTTAVGLWMRQFDVRNWGESSDPLPTSAPGSKVEAGYEGYAASSDRPSASDVPTEPADADEPVVDDLVMTYPIPVPEEEHPTSNWDHEVEPQTPQPAPEAAVPQTPAIPMPVPTEDVEEPVAEQVASAVQEIADVQTFSLDDVEEDQAEPDPSVDEEQEGEPTEEQLLSHFEDAIKSADMTMEAAEQVEDVPVTPEVPVFTLDVPASTNDDASERVVEVIDLTGNREESQEDEQ